MVLTACTTLPPISIPADNPTLPGVQADIAAHRDQPVVWGGQILTTEVTQTTSIVTLLAKPLDSNGEPVSTDTSGGRFIAHFEGFHDPAIFKPGRTLTVTGMIAGSETHKIGDYPYVYPIVVVQSYRLWPVQIQRDDYDGWYDPWWYPWYPWYYYPGYVPPPHRFPPPRK